MDTTTLLNSIPLFTLCVFAVMMVLESLFPRREVKGNLATRWDNNFIKT